MDWQNERYVRLYTRDTPTWELMSWEARSLFMHIMRKLDRSGVMDLGRHGLKALAASVRMPIEVVERCIPELEGEEYVEVRGSMIVLPNFIEAQEAPQSDRARQRESREKRRARARSGIRDDLSRDAVISDPEVTNRDAPVTPRDEVSRLVTPSQPSLASLSVPGVSERGQGPPQTVEEAEGKALARAQAAYEYLFNAVGRLRLDSIPNLPSLAPAPGDVYFQGCGLSGAATGYSLEELRHVIDVRVSEARKKRNGEFLKPVTVFSPKGLAYARDVELKPHALEVSDVLAFDPSQVV